MDSSPATPRRSARIQNLSPQTTLKPMDEMPSQTTKIAARRSPFLPTPLEALLLSIYPATLIVGSLFGLLDPAARAAPYNATTQSHFASTAPSYFAKKSNIFNILFVKRGWAWISISFFLFIFSHPSMGTPWTLTATPRRIRGTIRYAMVTAWWIFVTQWFFGPALIDRGFRLTGGACELAEAVEAGDITMDRGKQFVTSIACKTSGGRWAGGHDISGHVFLLVLGSMFLFEEVLHVVSTLSPRGQEDRTVLMADGGIKSAEVEADKRYISGVKTFDQWTLSSKIALGVASLSLYMLLMTAAYFHTWFEKLTGLIVALIGIFVTYFLPRVVPAIRDYAGLPGI